MAAVRHLDLIITSNATAAIRGFSDLGAIAKKTESKFGKLAGAMTRIGTVGVVGAVGFAGASVKAFIDFDAQMTKSLAIMDDVSGPMRKKMEDAAKAVAKTTTFSATEAAAAYKDLGSSGLTAEQAIKALPAVASFAQAGQMDMARASEYLVNAQKALGLEMENPIKNMKEMTRISDVLTKANNLATGEVEDFAAALSNKAGSALRVNNKDVEEGVAVLALFAEQGVQGATAGEKLAIFLRDIPRAAKANADEFRKFGISVFDSSGNLKNMADIVGEFERVLGPMSDGQKAATLDALGLTRSVGDVTKQLLGGSDQIREFERELRGAGGTTQEVADKQMESLKEKLGLVRDQFQVMMINFGEPIAIWLVDSFMPWLQDEFLPTVGQLGGILDKYVRPAFEAFGAALSNPVVATALASIVAMAVGLKTAVSGVGFLASAFSPLLKILTPLGKVLLKVLAPLGNRILIPLGKIFLTVAGSIGTFLASVGIIPILIAVAVAAALFAVYYFRDEIWAALQAVGRFFQGLWTEWIYPYFVQPIKSFFTGPFIQFWKDVWSQIEEPVMDVWQSLVQSIGMIVGAVSDVVSGIWGFIQDFFSGGSGGGGSTASSWAKAIFGPIKTAAQVLWEFFKAWGPTVWNIIKTTFETVRRVVMAVIPPIQSGFKLIVDIFRNLFERVGPVLIKGFTIAFRTISGVVSGVLRAVSGIISFFVNLISGNWGEAWDNLKSVFGGIWDAIFAAVTGGLKALLFWFKDLPGAVLGTIIDLIPEMLQFGKDILLGLWRGLLAGVSGLWGNIKNIFGGLIDFVKGLFGISSPSTVFASIGQFIIDGLLSGLKTAWSWLVSIVGGLIRAFVAVFKVWFSVITTVGGVVFRALGAIIGFAWNNVVKPILVAIGWAVTNLVVPAFSILWNAVKVVWTGIQAVIGFAWTVIRGIWNAIIVVARNVLAPIFRFIWEMVKVAWAGIQASIRIAWTVIQAIWNAIVVVARNVLAPIFRFIWEMVKVAWAGIQAAIGIAWTVIQAIWNAIVVVARNVLAPIFRFIWEMVKVAWSGIQAAIGIAWTVIQVIWNAIVVVARNVLAPIFRFLWEMVKVAWSGIQAAIGIAWTVIQVIWNAIVVVARNVLAPIFRFLWEMVKVAWSGIQFAIGIAWTIIQGIWAAISAVIRNVLVPIFKFLWEMVKVAWSGIQFAISIAWTIIQGIWTAIWAVITNVLVPIFNFLWNIIKTVWSGIQVAISFAWNNIIKPIWNAIWAVITNVLVPIFNFLWTIIKTVWSGIQTAISFAWNNIIKPIWNAIWAVITNVLVPIFNFLWGVIKTVWAGIHAAVSFAWNKIIKPIWDAIWGFITNTLAPKFETLQSVVETVWSGIRTGISTAWGIIKGIWNGIMGFIDDTFLPKWHALKNGITGAMGHVRDVLSRIWDSIKSTAKKGINGVINILNMLIGGVNGAKDLLNKIPGVNIPDIPSIPLIGQKGAGSGKGSGSRRATNAASFHAAGGIPNYNPMQEGPTRTHGVRAIVGEGNPNYPEFVIPTDPRHRQNAIKFWQQAGAQLFARGGVLPRGPGIAGLYDPLASKVQAIINEARGQVSITSGWRDSRKQAALYAAYKAGRGNLAAPPGSSNHERGAAVDFGGSLSVWRRLAAKHGLIFPVRGENWHAEDPSTRLGGLLSTAAQVVYESIADRYRPAYDFIKPRAPGKDIATAMVKPLNDQVMGAFTKLDEQQQPMAYTPGANANYGGGGAERWRPVALQALRAAGAPASWVGSLLRRMQQESGGNPRAINNWDSNARKGQASRGLMQCVPLDSEILTRRGWLTHDEVRVGDETLGYNPQTGRNEWTPITKVVYYEDAEIVRIGNGHWSARVTPNHRWWSDTSVVAPQPQFEECPECGWKPRGTKAPSRGVQVHRAKMHSISAPSQSYTTRGEFVRTHSLKSKHRLRLAAVAETDGIPGLSLEEAAIIGWLQGDGNLSKSETLGGQVWDGRIYQSKPAMIIKLRSLLERIEYTESVRERGGNTMPAHAFRLRRSYVTDLVKRSGIAEQSPEDFVLSLSAAQREAWLGAMIDAEGHTRDNFTRITQVDGPLQEAIKLAVYLEGYRPTYSATSAERNGYQPSGNVGMARPHVAPGMFHEPEELQAETVWCVKTDLETWTMRQDDQIMLTGNTIPSTFAAYAGPYQGRGIFDPLANIYAAIKYTVARYGSGPAGWDKKGGYKDGGLVNGDQYARLHDKEMVLPSKLSSFIQTAAAQGGGPTTVIEKVEINIPISGTDSDEEILRKARLARKPFDDIIAQRRILVDARTS